MTYKRNIDRLPIPPKGAKVHNVVCHYCIVGCGYHAISWDVDKQGGRAPDQNFFGVDLSKQQNAEFDGVVLAVDVQHRQTKRPRRAPRAHAGQELRGELRARIDPGRPSGRTFVL